MLKTETVMMEVNSDLKHEAEMLCADMGLTLSTAYTMLLQAIVHTRSIPFAIRAPSSDPFWGDTNQRHLMASIRELEAGHGEEHELVNA
ncbi:MAG: type II toxin-antitoxin system RelB/DinJ family antitoxin [Selenomonadaceae bacterium]|nr:type II toxin-antitoxin system RelB/DinJ family antitoxin [Selenomonadaceae bacterium]